MEGKYELRIKESINERLSNTTELNGTEFNYRTFSCLFHCPAKQNQVIK